MSLGLYAQAALICGTSWVLWKLLRAFFVKSALDNLPGPPSPSFLYGELSERSDTSIIRLTDWVIPQVISSKSMTNKDGGSIVNSERSTVQSASSTGSSGYVCHLRAMLVAAG